jgi:hypothetical protein
VVSLAGDPRSAGCIIIRTARARRADCIGLP